MSPSCPKFVSTCRGVGRQLGQLIRLVICCSLCIALMPTTHACIPDEPEDEPKAFGVPLSKWVNDLNSKDFNVRQAARAAIRSLGEKAAVAAKDLLKTPEGMAILRELGAAAVPYLLPVLDDPNQVEQFRKAFGLIQTSKSDETVSILVAELPSAPVSRQRAILELLGGYRDRAQGVVSKIRPFLQSADAGCRLQAACALTRIQPQTNAEAFPVLREFIETVDINHREQAADALCEALRKAAERGQWQQVEDEAAGLLPILLESEQHNVRSAAFLTVETIATVALGREGRVTPEHRQHLLSLSEKLLERHIVPALRDQEPDRRRAAITALGRFGPLAAPHVPDLVALLPQPALTLAVLNALRAIGPDAVSAVEAVRAYTTHENQEIRQAAGAALAAMTKRTILARDQHDGFTGFRTQKNIYVLSTDVEQAVYKTQIRFKARGDRGPDTAGVISISVNGQNWQEVGNWDRQSCERAAAKDHWHVLMLNQVPAKMKTRTLYVRFQYQRGAEQLNIYEVIWETRPDGGSPLPRGDR